MSMGLQLDTHVVADTPQRRRHWTPLRIALTVLGALIGLSVLRVATGENDIASSGAVAAAIGLAVPIGLAGLGGLWSERAGVVNIGLEGMMILGCWGSAAFALSWGPWAGLIGGILMGLVGGAVHAVATVYFGVDHVVSGVALNLIGPGAAKYLAARTWPQLQGVQSPQLPELPKITVPGLSDGLRSLEGTHLFLVSDIAGLLAGLVTDLSMVTVIAIGLVVASWWVLWQTPFGLRLRSCGESPAAAETLGVDVYRYKYAGVLISGALAGLAGSYLTLVAANMFRDGQTGGRGYIGLAALIFGNWRPGSLASGALMFGYFDAIQLRGNAIHGVLLAAGVALVALGTAALLRRRRGRQAEVLPALLATSALALGWYAASDSAPTAVRLFIGFSGAALLLGSTIVAFLTRREMLHLPAGFPGALAMAAFGLLVTCWYASSESVPSQLTGAAPYVATLLVLALASQNLRMPAADGLIYRKGETH
ncbi:nucleoside ABC transporter membrane protein [Austwickia chelonae]|uniref:Putative ABC transporter permease protein n=1 Tax=Austwickia chelonae NBRC 105200 TaxID=1184607 RepID=K6UKY8_9MICO|nr:ABC transporter permease [Austwickia chelonae]GAB76796.1 putative ABC transporter permease protein [Austwickia chelonae NBRC 105200]SEW30832.1 nucleoside ABC transporter membrane protein [Austwickia chelonae]